MRDAAAIATEAASKIIRKELSEEDQADLVSGVVQEYSNKTRGAGA